MCMPSLPDRNTGNPRITRIWLTRIFSGRTLDPISGKPWRTTSAFEPIGQVEAFGGRITRIRFAVVDG